MCTAFDIAALHDGLEPELGQQRTEPKVVDGNKKQFETPLCMTVWNPNWASLHLPKL